MISIEDVTDTEHASPKAVPEGSGRVAEAAETSHHHVTPAVVPPQTDANTEQPDPGDLEQDVLV